MGPVQQPSRVSLAGSDWEADALSTAGTGRGLDQRGRGRASSPRTMGGRMALLPTSASPALLPGPRLKEASMSWLTLSGESGPRGCRITDRIWFTTADVLVPEYAAERHAARGAATRELFWPPTRSASS